MNRSLAAAALACAPALVCNVVSLSARAQTAADLAGQVINPFVSEAKVPLQLNYDKTIGPGDGGKAYTLNIQPLIALRRPPAADTAGPMAARTPTPRDELTPGPDWLRTAGVLLGTVGGTLAYGQAKWWQDGFTGDFKAVGEGWFGQGTAYGGADKLGHAMFAYAGTRLLTRAYEWAGHDNARALQWGMWTMVGTLLAVEVFDGYSKDWSFSKEDAVADLVGGALGYLMETQAELDALIDLRLQYSPSTGPDGSKRSFEPLGDYSGQRYLAVFKASGVPALARQPLLRFLEFGIGYGTRNFESESRATTPPTRHVYYNVSLNLSELLRATVYNDNVMPSRTQRFTEMLFEYVQVPAVTATTDHVLD